MPGVHNDAGGLLRHLCTPAYATVQESMYMLFILFFFSTEAIYGY